MITDDGDIIRGLGFVALYAAYLEEQIDNLLMMLSPVETYDKKKQRWQISRKINHAIEVIEKLDTKEFTDYIADLRTCQVLFKERNEVIHGRIYGNFDRPDTLKSGRQNIPDKLISSAELFKLANEFEDFRTALYAPMIFKIPKAVTKYSQPNA